MENQNKTSFQINIKLMQIFRWYPENHSSRSFWLQGFVLYIFFLVLTVSIILTNILLERSYDNMQIIYVTETLGFCFKLLPFLRNGEHVRKCVNFFSGSDFAPKDTAEKEIAETSIKLCKIMSVVYLVGCTCAEVLYVVPSLVSKNYNLPMRVWLPYDPTKGPLTYYSTIFYLATACVYDASATSLIDPLIGGLAYQVVSQLKILKYRLQNACLGKDIEEVDNNLKNKSVIYRNLVQCVQHHNAILRFVEEYEECFSWPIFSQFMATTFVICFCCIALSTVPIADTTIYILFFCVAISQLLFYCYFGTLLYEENNTLMTAIYMSQWYEYDIESRKLLITIMEQAKRPMVVTAAKLVDLTLETFVTILKRSYSLIAVLK
ncbi:hypothetical protein Zmor_002371 [Zophobas morio]|uniref:Odorant receptor n=1 Tax=Zophobas morio TaxID=2755281 RepID=A0AA38MU13_9CUCU|nr:hypothetical protein Zmor_002371 [Zophobas morio]